MGGGDGGGQADRDLPERLRWELLSTHDSGEPCGRKRFTYEIRRSMFEIDVSEPDGDRMFQQLDQTESGCEVVGRGRVARRRDDSQVNFAARFRIFRPIRDAARIDVQLLRDDKSPKAGSIPRPPSRIRSGNGTWRAAAGMSCVFGSQRTARVADRMQTS